MNTMCGLELRYPYAHFNIRNEITAVDISIISLSRQVPMYLLAIDLRLRLYRAAWVL